MDKLVPGYARLEVDRAVVDSEGNLRIPAPHPRNRFLWVVVAAEDRKALAKLAEPTR